MTEDYGFFAPPAHPHTPGSFPADHQDGHVGTHTPAWDLPQESGSDGFGRSIAAEAAMMSRRNMATRFGPGIVPAGYPVGEKLGFFGSITAGWGLVRSCWRVLSEEPDLLLVPIVMIAAAAVICAGYGTELGGFASLAGHNRYDVVLHLFPLAVLLAVVAVLGQAVVAAAALDRLDGGSGGLARSWARVLGRFPTLIVFAVMFAAERTLTQGVLRGRSRILNAVADGVDNAWDFATFLAVPAILVEDLGPLAAVRRSGSLVRQRWGAQLVARGIIGRLVGLCALPFVLLALWALSVAVAAGVAALVLTLLVVVVVDATLMAILSAAMYRFATTGALATGFTPDGLTCVLARR